MKNFSDYHSVNVNQKLSHDGFLLLEQSLNGFEGYEVLINELVNTRMLVYQKYDAESTVKKVIGKTEDVEIGNLLKIDNVHWLTITFPEDNKIYRKAEIQLCNSTYPIKANKIKSIIGYYDNGKPEWGEMYETDRLEPCIVESRNYLTNTNTQLALQNNGLSITMRYQPSDTFKVNYEFNMYNENYKIIDVDYTKVINNEGIIQLLAERV
jgi:hypothetical protein